MNDEVLTKKEYELDLNHHLIGRHVQYVYKGDNWNNLPDNQILSIHATFERDKVQMLLLRNEQTDWRYEVSVEEALFNYGGEDDPLFVFTE